MTLAEFRAWLEGFTYFIEEAPSKAQWKLIQDKLASVNLPAISLPQSHKPPLSAQGSNPDWYQKLSNDQLIPKAFS